MAEERLKAKIWVQAQLRLCDIANIPAVVAKRGDPDAGAVLLKLNRLEAGCTVFAQARDAQGRPAWVRGTGAQPVTESAADSYIRRQIDRDSDLWVLEIEDRDGKYELDGAVI